MNPSAILSALLELRTENPRTDTFAIFLEGSSAQVTRLADPDEFLYDCQDALKAGWQPAAIAALDRDGELAALEYIDVVSQEDERLIESACGMCLALD